MDNEEVWKPIDFFYGYEVSNLGNVRNKNKKILIPSKNNSGYLKVNLRRYNKNYSKFIHRLVAQTFISNPNNLPEVNHKDENPLNNCVDNLEWCTSKYNANYGNRNNKCKYKKQLLYGKKVNRYDLDGNFIDCMYMSEAIKLDKVHYASLIRCCKGLNKTCGGYIFKYANE